MMLRGAMALTLALAVTPALAQNYPTHPVKVIVPYGVGGSAAVIGPDAVAKAAPDGHTILIMSNTHTVNESLMAKKPYDLLKDLAPVTGINSQDLLLVIS